MELSKLLILMLLISGVVAGYAGFYGGLMSSYGASSTEFASLNQTQDIYEKVEDMYETVNVSQENPVSVTTYILSAPANFIIGTIRAGMLVLNIPNLFMNLITDMTTKILHLPTWVGTMINGIIFVIVVAGIIKFVAGRVF